MQHIMNIRHSLNKVVHIGINKKQTAHMVLIRMSNDFKKLLVYSMLPFVEDTVFPTWMICIHYYELEN